MGETLPDDPMADVLTVMTGQGVVGLGESAVESGVEKDLGFAAKITDAALLAKFDSNQPRDDHGRWTATEDAASTTSSDASSREGSAAKTRQKIVDRALKNLRENPALWQDTAVRGNFDGTKNKCNLFVYEMLAGAGAGADPGLPHHSALDTLTAGILGNAYPPTAGDWANPKIDIPGWRVLSQGEKPEPEDVVAQRITFADASGHVMIVGPRDTFIGAGENNGPHGSLEQIPRKDYLGPLDHDGKELAHDPLVYRRWVGR
jgi:hypothetical protein